MSRWLQWKLACSLGQVRDVSGLVGFSCKLGWPQQLYTQDKDGEWHTQGTDTMTSCPGSMLRSPTRKTLVYTHRGSSVNCRLGDFTSHFSYKISLHRTLRDKKRMQWGTQTNRWKKWQVNVLKNSQNMTEKACPNIKSNCLLEEILFSLDIINDLEFIILYSQSSLFADSMFANSPTCYTLFVTWNQ